MRFSSGTYMSVSVNLANAAEEGVGEQVRDIIGCLAEVSILVAICLVQVVEDKDLTTLMINHVNHSISIHVSQSYQWSL